MYQNLLKGGADMIGHPGYPQAFLVFFLKTSKTGKRHCRDNWGPVVKENTQFPKPHGCIIPKVASAVPHYPKGVKVC